MDQASNWATPHQLRHMFVTLLIYCEVSNPLGLWEHCWKLLSEDILKKKQREFGFDQKKTYDAVLNSIDNNLGQFFFLNGAGGTGKTFLYKTIISKLRSIKKVVLPVASSGIVALLLPGRRTAHSRFKIPLQLNEDTMCEIKPGTMLAELLLKTDLII